MKPILFNTDMVRALLDGSKTVTRRAMRPQPPDYFVPCPIYHWWNEIWIDGIGNVKLPFEVGDVLYVRETWKSATIDPAGGGYALQDIYLYKADEPIDTAGMLVEGRWHPSIHMPKEAARVFLRVKAVRVERLQDIDEDGVIAEGAEKLITCPNERTIYYPEGGMEICYNTGVCSKCRYIDKSYPETFGELVWNRTVKPADMDKYGWDANPWVWVIEFERIDNPGVGQW